MYMVSYANKEKVFFHIPLKNKPALKSMKQ